MMLQNSMHKLKKTKLLEPLKKEEGRMPAAALTSSLSTGKNMSPLNARSLGALEYTAPAHVSKRGRGTRRIAKAGRG